uniref:Uncharacterized protein n=1 Tax=Steinernema glaseri TaxID=37863 RepID=A0A1I7Y334_9BILA
MARQSRSPLRRKSARLLTYGCDPRATTSQAMCKANKQRKRGDRLCFWFAARQITVKVATEAELCGCPRLLTWPVLPRTLFRSEEGKHLNISNGARHWGSPSRAPWESARDYLRRTQEGRKATELLDLLYIVGGKISGSESFSVPVLGAILSSSPLQRKASDSALKEEEIRSLVSDYLLPRVTTSIIYEFHTLENVYDWSVEGCWESFEGVGRELDRPESVKKVTFKTHFWRFCSEG